MKIAHMTARSPHAQPGSFRVLLQTELARRCSANTQYSLRAFAADVGVDHSTLSQLLRERRPITERSIRLIGKRLKVAEDVVDAFVTRERLAGDGASGSLAQLRQLTGDAASVVSDLSHYTILELVRLKGFKPDSRWIARVIGLSVDEVNVALNRLLRLGLLEMTGTGRWVDRSGDASATLDGFSLVAIHQFIQRIDKLRSRAMAQVPPSLRDHSSSTFALDTAKLPTIIEMIRRFRRELAGFIGAGEAADEVYQLEISLFPVTNLSHSTTRKSNGKPRRATLLIGLAVPLLAASRSSAQLTGPSLSAFTLEPLYASELQATTVASPPYEKGDAAGVDQTRPLARFDLRFQFQQKASNLNARILTLRLDAPFELGNGWKLGIRIVVACMNSWSSQS